MGFNLNRLQERAFRRLENQQVAEKERAEREMREREVAALERIAEAELPS